MTSSHFLSLPPELRLKIYDHLIFDTASCSDRFLGPTPLLGWSSTVEKVAQVSQQIRAELLPRYHRARGLMLLCESQHTGAWWDIFARSRVPLTKSFRSVFADGTQCKIHLKGGMRFTQSMDFLVEHEFQFDEENKTEEIKTLVATRLKCSNEEVCLEAEDVKMIAKSLSRYMDGV